MPHAAAEMLPDATVIVPVPLHRRRLLARRFSQSALLAQAIGRETAIKAIPICWCVPDIPRHKAG